MTKTYFTKRSDMYHYAASSDYNGEYIRSANSYVDGGDVYSYATLVAKFDKEKEILLYTGEKYSVTTTTSLWELRRAFDHFKCLKVYDFTVKDAFERLKLVYNRYSKHPATRKDDKQYLIDVVMSVVNVVEFTGKNSKYLKTKTFIEAEELATEYQKQIDAKNKRIDEIREARRQKAIEERRLKIKATEKICKEYDPSFESEPTTFKECLNKRIISIPVAWFNEHHPELDTEVYRSGFPGLYFWRYFDYQEHKWDDCYSYRPEDYTTADFVRKVDRYDGGWKCYPDILGYYSDSKSLRTSQGCIVNDEAGHVKTLLGLFLKAVDEGIDTSFVIGKHCGPYEIREYNASEKFLRVGCHCFLLENLREVYNDMKGE